MASKFIGYAVRVTVQNGLVLQGVVAGLEGQTLVLTNAFDLVNGVPYPFYRIEGNTIQELEVLNDGPDDPTSTPTPVVPPPYSVHPHPPTAHGQPQPFNQFGPRPPAPPAAAPPPPADPVQPTQSKKPFVDPAIVSIGRRPAGPTGPSPQPSQNMQAAYPPPPPPPPPPLVAAIQSMAQPPQVRLSAPPTLTQNSPTTPQNGRQPRNGSSSTATRPPFTTPALTSPFSKLKLGDAVDSSAFEETDDPSQASFRQTRRTPDGRARRGRRTSDASNFGSRQSQTRYAAGTSQRGRDNYGARRKHRHQNSTTRDEDGWATEDVNDIKEHEFDFQGNLERFDKKTVFSQIEAKDTTAAEDRLVSFNKRPQNAGEVGVPSIRKNFKNSENVLGTYANGASLADREAWNDNSFMKKAAEMESSSSEDEEDGGSGRSSRRGMTRPNRHGTSKLLRKASVNVSGRISPNISSGIGSGGGRAEQLTNSGDAKAKPILRLKTSSRPCPVVSPLQMLDVERIAEVDLGLTDDMMTENAGRGIAQVAIQAFGKRLHSGNHNSLPVVLVFAGNNKSGARAVAAGRHLKNHHVRVLICVLGLEREEELLDHLRRQIQIFRNAGGRLAHWNELSYKLQSLDAPPELIIDGLLGMHVAFEDLRLPDQASLFELVKFANTSKANIMSIDVPSGIDGQTGEVTTLDDAEPFYVKAKFVVCMGAPKTGVRGASNGRGGLESPRG